MATLQQAKDRMNQKTYHRYEVAELNHQNIVVVEGKFYACEHGSFQPDGNHSNCPGVAAVSRKNFTITVCNCKCHQKN